MANEFKALEARGYTSTIYYLPEDPTRVCKAFNSDRVGDLFPKERAVYQRFSAHNPPPSILRYYGVHDQIPAGIVLEYAPNQDVFNYIWDLLQSGQPMPPTRVLRRWAWQVTEALEFAHSLNVFNADIHCINFFLDTDLNLKVGDWAGAAIDGGRSGSSYRLRHRLFDADGTDVPHSPEGYSVRTEVFALGTAFFNMVTGQDPWPELREGKDDGEIKKLLVAKRFPDTAGLPALGNVIRGCWHVEFASMTEVKLAIEAETE